MRNSRAKFTGKPSAVAMARRPLLTLLCGLAFMFQAFVAQTHIHGSAPAATAFYKTVATGVQSPAKVPGQNPQDDINKCPLCQVAVAVGTAIGPNVFYVLEPPTSGIVEALRELQRPVQAVRAYIWRNRGPPQH